MYLQQQKQSSIDRENYHLRQRRPGFSRKAILTDVLNLAMVVVEVDVVRGRAARPLEVVAACAYTACTSHILMID